MNEGLSNASERTRYCPSCGLTTPHSRVYSKWSFDITRCRTCGLGATVTPPDFDPATLYDAAYYQGGRVDGYADYAGSEQVLRAEFRRVVAELRKTGPSSGRLLEIGCAHGFFLLEAQPYYECQGVDISADAIHEAQRRGLNARQGRPGEDEFALESPVDVVVLLDCVEHLPRPDKTLEWAYQALSPGGTLLIATGDWDSPLARWMGKRWRLMTPPQHLHFFSRKSLTSMSRRLGFTVVTCRRPWKIVPLGLMAYQVGRRLGHRSRWLEKFGGLGLPVTLFDTVRLIARKLPTTS